MGMPTATTSYATLLYLGRTSDKVILHPLYNHKMLRYVRPSSSKSTRRPYTSFRRRQEHQIVPKQLMPEGGMPIRDGDFIRKNILNAVMQSASMHAISKRSLSKKALDNSQSVLPAYLEREAKERELTALKNLNNDLVKENYKLKSRIRCLDTQIRQLQNRSKVKRPNELSRDMIDTQKKDSHNWKKQLEETKAVLQRLKRSVRCTAIQQLQAERDVTLQQLKRLRELVAAGQAEKQRLKMERKGFEKLKKDCRKVQSDYRKFRSNQTEKRKEEQKIEEKKIFQTNNHDNFVNFQLKKKQNKSLRTQLKRAYNLLEECKWKHGKQTINKPRHNVPNNNKIMALGTPSACKQCQQLKIATQHFQAQVQRLSQKVRKLNNGGSLNGTTIHPPFEVQLSEVARFLTLRFKALRLPREQATLYLLKNQNLDSLEDHMSHMSMDDLIQVVIHQPFQLITDRYIQTFIYAICHQQQGPFRVEIEKTFAKAHLRQRFIQFIGDYKIEDQSEEQQLFFEQRQYLASNPQIFAQLKGLQTENNIISQGDFCTFFSKIGQDKQHIDFMLTHIILEAFDLEHLNLFELFEVFNSKREQEEDRMVSAIEEAVEEEEKPNLTHQAVDRIAPPVESTTIEPLSSRIADESILPKAALQAVAMAESELSQIHEDPPALDLELLLLRLFGMEEQAYDHDDFEQL